MILPTLPTDNLYKFLALSGLAILIFGVVYPYKLANELELKIVDVGTQIKLLEFESAAIGRVISLLEQKKDLTRDEIDTLRIRQK